MIAFVLGALVLTVLPLIQRLSLRAPAPLERLGSWSLEDVSTDRPSPLEHGALSGKVLMVGFVPTTCDVECRAALESFGKAGEHVADLGDKVALVSFVEPGAVAVARTARAARPSESAPPSWRLLSGDATTLTPVWATFARSWDAQMKTLTERRIQFLARPTLAVVDQDGAIRGFWPADDEGRGHAINAARMFARYGTEP